MFPLEMLEWGRGSKREGGLGHPPEKKFSVINFEIFENHRAVTETF